jgi:hypothetical protein
MKTLGTFPVHEILPLITDTPEEGINKVKVSLTCNDIQYSVKVSSPRLVSFKKSHECAMCGIKGEMFFLQQFTSEPPHLNLYGYNKEKLVLLTYGKDEDQTLCYPCNTKES